MNKNPKHRSDQAREVAEILISNSADHSSQSLTRYHAINNMPANYDSLYHNENYLRETLAAGSLREGRISAVRRFFCLFVTFDFLFTTLLWIICLVITGENIEKMLIDQIVRYTISGSLFDIVMASAGRFVILLLFYALLCINHWWVIAITTAGSCGFLIIKVFFYEWAKATNYTLDVFLVLSSFVLSWGEAWFLDFRVLPQESLARDFFRAITSEDERQPLLQNQAVPSVRSNNLDDFYSPIDSPQESDDEQQNRGNRSTLEDEELARKAEESFDEAWSIINSDGWKVEKQTPEGDIVHSKHIRRNHKIFRITGTVEIPPKLLYEELDQNIEHVPSWNPTLLECRTLKVVNDKVSISYQLAAEGGGGIISARDFVNLRYCDVRNGVYICSGASIVFPDMPAQKGYVRGENGPGCWVMTPIPNEPNKCVFQWLLDTNLKGWIPQSIIDTALSFAMCDYIRYVRTYAETLRQEGKF